MSGVVYRRDYPLEDWTERRRCTECRHKLPRIGTLLRSVGGKTEYLCGFRCLSLRLVREMGLDGAGPGR